MPPGSYDPKARVKEIAVDGVEAEVLYPSIALRMFQIADMPYQVACFKAYNSWLSDFCKVDPNRFKGIGVVPIDDIEAAVGEIHRCRKIGLAGVSISVNPVDEEGYDNPRFEPLWRAAQDQGMPVSLHILTERRSTLKPGMDFIVQQVLDPGAIQAAFTRMIFSGVFDKFPRLKVVSAENDIGWSGYFVERIDYLFERRKAFHKWVIKRQPSEFFHEHCYLTFMRDRSGILVRGIAGVDNIMWSSDYPHLDSTYPKSQQLIESMMGDIPAADRRKIVCENAAKLYGFN
ncbi:MAG: amidohydrolase [Chloroflexi bacterium]|nr:amidohydrolase [Chloroflexota bacterium]